MVTAKNPEKERSPEYLKKWKKENKEINETLGRLSDANDRRMIEELEKNGLGHKSEL